MFYYTHELLNLFVFFCICLFIAAAILAASFQLSLSIPDSEKLSTYECGFDPYGDARESFDVRFYIVGLLFLVFDLETIFFLPWVISLSFLSTSAYWGMVDFIVELLAGFIYVWKIGILCWD